MSGWIHWARIGREPEASPEVPIDHVAESLLRARAYDALGAEEQAIVRAWWAERMGALLEALRLDQEFAAEGVPYVELEESGAVVRREAGSKAAGAAGRPRSRVTLACILRSAVSLCRHEGTDHHPRRPWRGEG